MNLMRKLCERVASHLPVREIWDRAGGSLYLSRYYILGGPRDVEKAFDATGQETEEVEWMTLPFNLYLHKFHRSDDDGALHNHPWKWSVSLILAGGYSEERRYMTEKVCDLHAVPHVVWRVRRRDVLPFTLNVIRGDDFHRVDLREKDCWSLFIAGPKASSWGFWDRITDIYTPWREFIAQKRGVAVRAVSSSYAPGEEVKTG